MSQYHIIIAGMPIYQPVQCHVIGVFSMARVGVSCQFMPWWLCQQLHPSASFLMPWWRGIFKVHTGNLQAQRGWTHRNRHSNFNRHKMYKWQCSVSKIWCNAPCSQGATSGRLPLQICCFNAATGKAFTTVLAGWGLTFTSLPNIILLPPFVAFFLRVLIMQRPGSVNLPFFFTSLLPISASASNTFESSPFFNPAASANSVARAPLDINFALFIAFMVALAFIAFIGAIAGALIGFDQ